MTLSRLAPDLEQVNGLEHQPHPASGKMHPKHHLTRDRGETMRMDLRAWPGAWHTINPRQTKTVIVTDKNKQQKGKVVKGGCILDV